MLKRCCDGGIHVWCRSSDSDSDVHLNCTTPDILPIADVLSPAKRERNEVREVEADRSRSADAHLLDVHERPVQPRKGYEEHRREEHRHYNSGGDTEMVPPRVDFLGAGERVKPPMWRIRFADQPHIDADIRCGRPRSPRNNRIGLIHGLGRFGGERDRHRGNGGLG